MGCWPFPPPGRFWARNKKRRPFFCLLSSFLNPKNDAKMAPVPFKNYDSQQPLRDQPDGRTSALSHAHNRWTEGTSGVSHALKQPTSRASGLSHAH